MAKKKIITICSSANFYKTVVEVQAQLQKQGYRVKVPLTASKMKRVNDFDVSHYRTWLTNPKDYKRKTYLMRGHFKKVTESDAILVINLEKKGYQGYIGGNVLMEMALAFYLKKPIFIYNNVQNDLPNYEEVIGLRPIMIERDLTKIHLH